MEQTGYVGILAWRDLSIYDGFRSRFAIILHSYRPINGNGQRRFDKGNTRGFQGFAAFDSAFANDFDRIVRLDQPVGQTRYLGISAWRYLPFYDSFGSRFANNPHSHRPINGNGQWFDNGNTMVFQGSAECCICSLESPGGFRGVKPP